MTGVRQTVFNVVARQEFCNFRVNIFFPFIGDKQTRTTVVGKDVTAQGIDDARMGFIWASYDDNKSGSCIDDGADSHIASC